MESHLELRKTHLRVAKNWEASFVQVWTVKKVIERKGKAGDKEGFTHIQVYFKDEMDDVNWKARFDVMQYVINGLDLNQKDQGPADQQDQEKVSISKIDSWNLGCRKMFVPRFAFTKPLKRRSRSVLAPTLNGYEPTLQWSTVKCLLASEKEA